MSISYPLTPPTSPAQGKRTKITARTAAGLSISPFTYAQQAQEYSGQRWELEVTLPPMASSTAADWRGFFAALAGVSGTFYWKVPDATQRGPWTGTPLVNGATAAQSKTLPIDGLSNSITGIVKSGDYFNVGTMFLMAVQDANSNGSGQATLDIFPRLAGAVADNAPIVLTTPKMLCRLVEPVEFDIDEALIYGFSFKAMEAR